MIDFPTYPPEAFDADGYLTVEPQWSNPDGTERDPTTGVQLCPCPDCRTRRAG